MLNLFSTASIDGHRERSWYGDEGYYRGNGCHGYMFHSLSVNWIIQKVTPISLTMYTYTHVNGIGYILDMFLTGNIVYFKSRSVIISLTSEA